MTSETVYCPIIKVRLLSFLTNWVSLGSQRCIISVFSFPSFLRLCIILYMPSSSSPWPFKHLPLSHRTRYFQQMSLNQLNRQFYECRALLCYLSFPEWTDIRQELLTWAEKDCVRHSKRLSAGEKSRRKFPRSGSVERPSDRHWVWVPLLSDGALLSILNQ